MRVSFSLTGWLRYWRLKSTDRVVIVRGSCRQCGRCCRKMCIDIDGSWLKSARKFERFADENPDYRIFRIRGRDLHGRLEFSCSWLGSDGLCKAYDKRLPICKNYPEPELYFTGGSLLRECGYYFEETINFEKLLRMKSPGEKGEKG